MRFPGNALDKFCYVMCSQLQISYEKLTEKERTDLKNIMKKSGIYKDSPLGNLLPPAGISAGFLPSQPQGRD